MPIYEYACSTCKAEFEVLVRRKADIPTRCPKCGKGKPVKQFSSFAALSASSVPSCAEACPSGSACAATPGGCAGGGCMLND